MIIVICYVLNFCVLSRYYLGLVVECYPLWHARVTWDKKCIKKIKIDDILLLFANKLLLGGGGGGGARMMSSGNDAGVDNNQNNINNNNNDKFPATWIQAHVHIQIRQQEQQLCHLEFFETKKRYQCVYSAVASCDCSDCSGCRWNEMFTYYLNSIVIFPFQRVLLGQICKLCSSLFNFCW